MASQAKRNRPCDACRRRKSKCVTEDGSSICVLCKFHHQDCTYLEAPQPRKRAANPAGTLDGNGQSPFKRARLIHIKPGTGVEEYDALPGPSLLKRTLGLQNRHHSEYIGLHCNPDVYSPQSAHPPDPHGPGQAKAAGDYVRFVSSSHAFRIIPDNGTENYDGERSVTDEIEATARGNGPQLVELYFRIVHPSFPVLHKDVFLEKYSRSYTEFSPPLLAAVYLLASCYWSYSDSLSQARRIDSDTLQALAFDSLQNTMRRPKLSTIQAGLLLSQYQKAFMGVVPNEQRDRLTVQLVNLAHGLGLHLDCSTFDIPDWEIGLRRRIAWGLYMQDKWTALLEGRPSLISSEDWDVADLSELDFPEVVEDEQEGSSEVGRGRLVFTHMAHLSVILSEILRTIFSTRALRAMEDAPDSLSMLLERVKPLQILLRDWSATLPDSLRMETAASMKLSSVGYLRLAYLTVEVCVHRNLIRTLANLASSEQPVDPTLAQVCRAAARERFVNATDFIQRLQAQHLASFWYFASAKCCALIHSLGQMLEVTAPTDAERAEFAQKLKEFKWILKVNSEAGAGFMKQALALINHSVRVVPFGDGYGSALTSPASAGLSRMMASPEMQQHVQAQAQAGVSEWTQEHDLDGDYFPGEGQVQEYDFDHGAFEDADGMFQHYPDVLDGSWLPEIS